MIRINLLPPKQQKPFWTERLFYIIGTLLLIVCLGGVRSYLYFQEYTLSEQLRQIRQQNELLKPTQAQMQAAGAKLQAITAREAVLLNLTKQQPPLYAAVARLGAITPNGVWLTTVSGDKNGLKIAGMAKSYPEAAEFLKRTQEDAMYTDFNLIKAEQDKITAKFEFTVKLKGM